MALLDIFKPKTAEPARGVWYVAISPKSGDNLGLQFECKSCGRKVLTQQTVNCCGTVHEPPVGDARFFLPERYVHDAPLAMIDTESGNAGEVRYESGSPEFL